MDLALLIALALGGLVAASFVNASVVRWIGWRVVLPQFSGDTAPSAALESTPGRCRVCGASLSPWGRGSISWITTLGRCRGSGRHRLALRYLFVDLLLACLWVAAGVSFGAEASIVPVLVLITGLVAMAVVDLWVMRIPNRFVYGTHAVLIPSIIAVSLVDEAPGAIAGAAVGAVAYFGFLFFFHLLSPRRMGFGDVRLAGVMGMALGWLGWRADQADTARIGTHWAAVPIAWVVWAALIGSLIGTVAGIVSLIVRRRSRPFPFGPALVVGCLIVVFYGDRLVG